MDEQDPLEYEREKDNYDQQKLLYDLEQMGITDNDLLQIEQAASGCIDKTIFHWYLLNTILKRIGIDLPDDTPATTVTSICRLLTPDAIANLLSRRYPPITS